MAEVETVGRFACDGCGKQYRWKPQWAGRKLKCKCGSVVACPGDDPAVPAAPAGEPSGDDDGMYDVAADPAPRAVAPVGTVLVPSEPVPGAPAAVGAAHVPHGAAQLGYRRPEPTEGAVAEYFPDRVKDLYAPLWLIGGGTVVELVAAVIRYRGSPRGLSAGMTEVGVTLVVGTVFMLVGILIAARVRGLDLGKFWTAVLKLAAISIAPGAVVTLASPALMLLPIIGALLGWGINFCLYFALIGMLFDLDESDTWFVVVVVFLVKVAVAIALIFGVLSQIRA